MKNQYACDIGDYTKLGLLRCIQKTSLNLGVNWYLTPDDGRSDGKFTEYLYMPDDGDDAELHTTLRSLVDKGSRSISALETSGLLTGTRFFNDMLDFAECNDTAGRQRRRTRWHFDALANLKHCDVVFLDPDNGLEVASVKPYTKNGNKYVTYEEASDYYKSGASVIVYNHRDRSPEQRYLDRFLRFKTMTETQNANLQIVRAFRTSVRDYVFLIQPKHLSILQVCLDSILQTSWSNHMRSVSV